MDRAAGPLFDRVEDDVLQRPTYKGKLLFSIACEHVCKSSLIK